MNDWDDSARPRRDARARRLATLFEWQGSKVFMFVYEFVLSFLSVPFNLLVVLFKCIYDRMRAWTRQYGTSCCSNYTISNCLVATGVFDASIVKRARQQV